MENEIWKDVPSYKGILKVSNLGRVKEYIVTKNGVVYKNRILKQNKGRISYKETLYTAVSKLMAEAFIKDYTSDKHVYFKDNDPKNLCLENLRISDIREIPTISGANNHLSKLKDSDILKITERLLNKESVKSISEDFGIHPINVYRIARKEIWKHVDRPVVSIRKVNAENSHQKLLKKLSEEKEFNKTN